jgi:hypothetical protein
MSALQNEEGAERGGGLCPDPFEVLQAARLDNPLSVLLVHLGEGRKEGRKGGRKGGGK